MKYTMMKTLAVGLFMYGNVALAVDDYSRYNNEELMQMRDQVQEMNTDERDAYRGERQQRMQNMSQEERQNMRGNNNSQMNGNQMRQKMQERMNNSGQRQGGGGGGMRGK